MARDMVRGGSGNNLDNPTRQTGRVFFISRRNYDRAIQLEHPCFTPLGSRGAVILPHVVNGGPEGSINNRIFIPDRVSPFRYVVGQPHVIH